MAAMAAVTVTAVIQVMEAIVATEEGGFLGGSQEAPKAQEAAVTVTRTLQDIPVTDRVDHILTLIRMDYLVLEAQVRTGARHTIRRIVDPPTTRRRSMFTSHAIEKLKARTAIF